MMMPWMFLLPLTILPVYFPLYVVATSFPVALVGLHLLGVWLATTNG